MWFRGITEEAITKFDGTNIKLVCEEVTFDASYSDSYIYLSNSGNVPIYKMKAQITGAGSHETITLGSEDDSWPETGLLQGGTYQGFISQPGDEMILIPVLAGETDEGEKTHTCDERNGKKIIMS